MAKYRKKPVEVEAMQWTGNEFETAKFLGITLVKLRKLLEPGWKKGADNKGELIIKTLEGPLIAKYGDFIVKGGQGEYWPINEKIFPTLYDQI